MEDITNKERLALVEHKTKEISKKVDEVLKKLDNLDERYPTRREMAAVNWILGIMIGAIGLVVAIIKLTI